MKRFNIGDIVICLKSVSFMCGSKHIKGKEYLVTPETEAYFNVCSKGYTLKEK